MTEIIPFKPKEDGFKSAEDAQVSNEISAMADRLEEIAQTSNMQSWMMLFVKGMRQIADAYKRQD